MATKQLKKQSQTTTPITAASSRNDTRVLSTLFRLLRGSARPDIRTLAVLTGISVANVMRSMAALEARGLVDASRVRLTMLGLAEATQLVDHDELFHVADSHARRVA